MYWLLAIFHPLEPCRPTFSRHRFSIKNDNYIKFGKNNTHNIRCWRNKFNSMLFFSSWNRLHVTVISKTYLKERYRMENNSPRFEIEKLCSNNIIQNFLQLTCRPPLFHYTAIVTTRSCMSFNTFLSSTEQPRRTVVTNKSPHFIA